MKNLFRFFLASTAFTAVIVVAGGCNQTSLNGVNYEHYYGESGEETDGGGDTNADSFGYESETAQDGGDESSSDTSFGSGAESETGAEPVCGDGNLDEGEACDDGEGNADNAACTSDCNINVCGDGLVYEGVEECDLGEENVDGGLCDTNCVAAQPE